MNDNRSGNRQKKHKKRSKVGPDDNVDLIGEEVEMDDKKINKSSSTMLLIRDAINKKKPNPINMITNLKQGARRWKDYATTRRKQSQGAGADGANDRRRTGGQGLTPDLRTGRAAIDNVDGVHLSENEREMRNIHNRNLIEYFARLGSSSADDTCVNLEYIESVLLNGADINCTDKHGQSVLHEASRAWDVDVARFLIEECEAKVNQPDDLGRTPLHVAAAVDYPEMVSYLMRANANKEARTKGEEQTAVHFAARNDACMSLKALIKNGCLYKEVSDYKGRTPLHVAAELDRSETARMLLEFNDPAPAGVMDNSGQSAIVWMITKMPSVAMLALDQFHTTDRANRKQFYHLNWLEPRKPGDERQVFPQSAMQVILEYRSIDLITHPVIARLIQLKWAKFGKLRAVVSTVTNLAFILTWTIQGMIVPYNKMHYYDMPSHWWRIVLYIVAFLLTIWQIKEELREVILSKRQHSHWRNWRVEEIQKDMEYVHPRWPEEAQYLTQELAEMDKHGPQYFHDFWNIFDWICYALLFICFITHIVDVVQHTDFTARLHIRLMAITIILIWLRLMKNARAFALIGPLIVIVGHMIDDCIKFLFLYFEFYLPFACAFWMIFGGSKVPEQYQGLQGSSNYTVQVSGMGDFGSLAFTLFRLTLVDEYDYDGMKSVDNIMTHILLVSWFALSAILMLNLFIALLSDTFQRVYDNANANAVMQKAITILSIEEGLSAKTRESFRKFIHDHCSPEKDVYDDDTTNIGGEQLKKITFQIKDDLERLSDRIDDHLLPSHKKGARRGTDSGSNADSASMSNSVNNSGRGGDKHPVSSDMFERFEQEMRNSVNDLLDQQEQLMAKVNRDMSRIKGLLQQVAMATIPRQGAAGPAYATDINNMQMVVRRPLMSQAVTSGGVNLPPVMDFGEPVVRATRSPIAHLQPGQSAAPDRPPPGGDHDWDNIERVRRQDLTRLRAELSARQQLASHGGTRGHSPPATEDEAALESTHTDTTIVGHAETSSMMSRTLPTV